MSQNFLSSLSCHDRLGWLRPGSGAMSRGLALCFALVFGCGGSDGGGGTGTGGSHPGGTGGLTGLGGTTASGGNTGTTSSGGTVGTGGVTGTGGLTVTGGNCGTGGATGTGGLTVTGGKSGSGGAVSTGGAGETGGTTGTGGSNGTGGSSPRDGGLGSGGSAAGGAGGRGSGGSSGSGIDGGTGNAVASAGCGKTPTLKNSHTQNTISGSRQFIVRWPTDYKNTTPYRLIFNLHGANGSDLETSGDNYGLWSLSGGSTIFVSLSAVSGSWNATADTTYANDVLKAVEADLCIDTTRVMLEGFSMGGAMARVLGCASPGVFRAIVGHSAGGVTLPSTCKPIPYLGSLGLSDVAGNSQATQTDPFAKWNGCTMETLPTASTGSHVCTPYKGCPAADPVTWCSYDGGHTPSPTDSGKSTSWLPSVVWPFFSQF